MLFQIIIAAGLVLGSPTLACDSCEHPERDVVLTRNVRRMQPDAENATVLPKGPLAWGKYSHDSSRENNLTLM